MKGRVGQGGEPGRHGAPAEGAGGSADGARGLQPCTRGSPETGPGNPAAPARPAGAGGAAPDIDSIRAAVRESSAHVRHWVRDVYELHGLPQRPHGAPESTPQSPALRSLRLLLSVRYLILELWNFQEIYGHYTQAGGRLGSGRADGLAPIIGGDEVHHSLGRLRNKLVHSEGTLGEFADEIGSLGLDSLVHYARTVMMFGDAAMPAPRNQQEPGGADWDPIRITFEVPRASDGDAFAKKYLRAGSVLDTGRHRRDYAIMGDLRLSLLVLYTGFLESARHTSDNTLDSCLGFTEHVYNIKYMILDIHNFIERFKKLEIRSLAPPGFISREGLYGHLRNDYSAHARIGKARGMAALLGEHPDLLSHILLDIVEIDALATGLLDRFETPPTREIPLMSREQIELIDQRMGSYGGGPADPGGDSESLEARRLAKERLSLA